MADTFGFEEARAPATFSFEEAAAPASFSFEEALAPAPEPSRATVSREEPDSLTFDAMGNPTGGAISAGGSPGPIDRFIDNERAGLAAQDSRERQRTRDRSNAATAAHVAASTNGLSDAELAQRQQAGRANALRDSGAGVFADAVGAVPDLVRDTGIGLARGAVGTGVKLPLAAQGMALDLTGTRDAAASVGLRNRDALTAVDDFDKWLSSLKSDAGQGRDRRFSETRGLADTMTMLGANPGMIADKVAESLVGTVAIGAVAGIAVQQAMPRLTAAAEGLGLTGKAAEDFISAGAVRVAQIAAPVAEGAQSTLDTAGDAQQRGRTVGQYGVPALAAGAGTAAVGFAANKLGARAGIGDIETDIALRRTGIRAAQSSATGRAERMLAEGTKEGLLEEGPQSVWEAAWQNIALGQPWDQGLGKAAAVGAVTGFGMGGAHAAVRGGEAAAQSRAVIASHWGETVAETAAPIAEPVAAIATAQTVDQAIAAAQAAISIPPRLELRNTALTASGEIQSINQPEAANVSPGLAVPPPAGGSVDGGPADSAPGLSDRRAHAGVSVGAAAAGGAAGYGSADPVLSQAPGNGRGELAGVTRRIAELEAGRPDAVPAAQGAQPLTSGAAAAVMNAPEPPAIPVASYTQHGTLQIMGELQAIKAILSQAGVTSFIPMRGGVLVARSQTEQAAAVMRDYAASTAAPPAVPAAPPAAPPAGTASVDQPVQAAASAATEQPSPFFVAGDPVQLRQLLRENGITSVVPRTNGVVVARAQADQARQVIQAQQASREDQSPAQFAEMSARQRAEFAAAEKVRSAPGARARSRAHEANPFRAFLGKHGLSLTLASAYAPGPTERRSLLVPGYGPVFRRSGKQLDHLAQNAVEEGYLTSPDVAQLEELISRVMRGERVFPQYAEGAAETEAQRRIDRARQFEEDDAVAASASLQALEDNELFDLDDAVALDAGSNTSTEAAMRALGFSEQETTNAIAKESRVSQADRRGPGEAEETSAGKAEGDPRGRDEAARPEAEGLTRPTPAEIEARQEQARAAERDRAARDRQAEQRNRADAELPEFTLTGSDLASDRNPAQGDVFSGAGARDDDVPSLDRATPNRKAGMAVAAVRDALAVPLSKLTIPHTIHATAAAASEAVGTQIPDGAKGMHFKGRLHLIAENIKSPLQAEITFWHEIQHAGLHRSVGRGNGYEGQLREIALKNKNVREAAKAWMTKYGEEDYRARMKAGMSKDGALLRTKLQAVDEALAQMASANVQINGMAHFIAKVQEFMRSIGLDRLANYLEGKTDAEALSIILTSRAAVMGKANRSDLEDGAAVPALSRDDAGAPFYSALLRSVEAMNFKGMGGALWKDAIKGLINKGAVKADEVEWSGVREWLEMQDGKVSKEQLAGFLMANGVQVAETMRGDLTDESKREVAFHKQNVQFAEDNLRRVVNDAADLIEMSGASQVQVANAIQAFRQDRPGEGSAALDRAYALLQKAAPEGYDLNQINDAQDQVESAKRHQDLALQRVEKTSKFGNYQLPGGENYRELLLTLPARAQPKQALKDWRAERFSEATGADYDGWDVRGTMPDGNVFRSEIGLEDAATAEQAIAAAQRVAGVHEMTDEGPAVNYRSGHWDEANVLAHIRFNERTDTDGRRVLFVEEIQSDWAQDGKKRGFADPAAAARIKELTAEMGKLATDREMPSNRMREEARWHELAREREAADRSSRGVAHAPFVGKTDAWVSLAIKRMVKYAVDNGFDRVAFINGQQSADRYSLTRVVNGIGWDQLPGEPYRMVSIQMDRGTAGVEVDADGVVKREANDAARDLGLSGKNLREIIGRELAEKVLQAGPHGQLDGAGLEVGGQGMKAFYDKIVPAVTNDVLRKLGGGRMGEVTLRAPPPIKGSGWESTETPGPQTMAPKVQPGFDITPAMREKAADGVPMFSRADGADAMDASAEPATRSSLADRLAYQGYERAEVPRVPAARNLNTLIQQHDDGELTDGEFGLKLRMLAQRMADVSQTKQANRLMSERERGADLVREKLIRARRQGDVSDETTEFALWLLDQNPALADDLGLSVRSPAQGTGAGRYNPAARVSTLFKGAANDGTAVHEILHHTERMMPAEVQAGIRSEWAKAYAAALKDASTEQRPALVAMLDAIAGSRTAQATVMKAFRNGTLDYAMHYQLVNPSEFWAVNATSIMRRRFKADSWIGKAKQWLAEMIETAKGIFGLRSDSPVLAGLKAVLAGDGSFVSGKMLSEADVLGDITASGAAQREGVWTAPEPTTTDKFLYEAQDGRIDLKRAQEAIAASGREIEEQFDARLAETLYPGRVAYRSQEFLKSEVRPLLLSMAINKVTMTDLSDYLLARHAPERNEHVAAVNPGLQDGGAGTNSKGELMTTAAAKAYLAKIDPGQRKRLEAVAGLVDAITAGTRRLLVDEGLELPEVVQAWEGAYKFYAPLFKDEAERGFQHPQGTGFNVKGSASKRSTGSTREVVDVLAHVLMQREAAITRAEKNRVGLALYGLALSHPNPDFWTPIKPSMSPGAIAAELEAMGVPPEAIDSMQGAPTITSIDPITNQVRQYPNPMYRNLPGAITLKVGGEDRVLMLNANNERAARLATNLKNLDGLTKLDLAARKVGLVTRWIASVNTRFNPAFGLVNAVRDLLSGMVNLTNTPLHNRKGKVFSNVPAAIIGIARDLRSDSKRTEWSDLYVRFQKDGGQTGYKEMFGDAGERTRAIEKELASLQSAGALTTGKAVHAVLDLLGDFNDALENGVRLSAYKAALDDGLSGPAAAKLARELTVDFNRRGRTGRELSPLYAFLNASLQGTARTIETLRGPAGPTIIAAGFALGALQALLLAAAGYDDDDVPEWVKARALIIPTGWRSKEKRYIAIPLPLGLNVLPNTGRVLTELALYGDKDAGRRVTNAIGEIFGALNPMGGGNIFTFDGFLKTFAPTVVDPLIELGANKNFAGNPIERKPFNEEGDNRPGYERARESTRRSTTGQVYLGVSKAVNSLTGGTKYEAGAVSPSPEQVRYLAQVVGGGALRELEKAVDASVEASAGRPVRATAIPLASRFVGEVDDDNVAQTRYYDAKRRIEKIQSSLRAAEKAGDAVAYRKILKDHPEVIAHQDFQRTQKSITELNKLAVETIGNPERLKQIDKQRAAEMRALNESLRRIEKREPALADRLRGDAP